MRPALTTLRTQLRQALLDYSAHDARIVGVLDYGSSSEGRADALSDLDIALFISDEALEAFTQQWKTWAAQFGRVLLAYVGGVGHPWVVYDAEPLPLRVDFAFQRASAMDTVLTWPNAPRSVEAMLLYDASDGRLATYVQQIVGQSLAPADRQQAFESSCGDFWYYMLRCWTKLLRNEHWTARYDFNYMVLGILVSLLRIEAKAIERWRISSGATKIEQMVSAQRLQQLQACIPDTSEQGLRQAFYATALLGYDVCAAVAHSNHWSWPEELAQGIITIVARDS